MDEIRQTLAECTFNESLLIEKFSVGHNFESSRRMRVASRPSSPHNPPPNTGSQYFDRRGEVNELRQALRSGLAERDLEKLKDSVKKVIGYMTLGIDMSRLFSEMVMAAQLGDLVQKKLV